MDSKDVDAEYRKHCVEARQKAQVDFDKILLVLAGGALGLSLTFVKEVLGANVVPSSKFLLGSGWVLLVASLLAVLASFCASRYALGSTIKRLDGGDRKAHVGRWATCTEILNIAGGALFIAGISLVVWFACVNLGAKP